MIKKDQELDQLTVLFLLICFLSIVDLVTNFILEFLLEEYLQVLQNQNFINCSQEFKHFFTKCEFFSPYFLLVLIIRYYSKLYIIHVLNADNFISIFFFCCRIFLLFAFWTAVNQNWIVRITF